MTTSPALDQNVDVPTDDHGQSKFNTNYWKSSANQHVAYIDFLDFPTLTFQAISKPHVGFEGIAPIILTLAGSLALF